MDGQLQTIVGNIDVLQALNKTTDSSTDAFNFRSLREISRSFSHFRNIIDITDNINIFNSFDENNDTNML